MRAIGDVAPFITSKNAGPFLLTLDIVFSDDASSRTIHHLVEVDDPLELFPVEIIEG